jgi:hypothetical protein
MSKKSDISEPGAEVRVVLTCVYSGLEKTFGPGDVLAVTPEEAERLIGLGAASPYVEADASAAATE